MSNIIIPRYNTIFLGVFTYTFIFSPKISTFFEKSPHFLNFNFSNICLEYVCENTYWMTNKININRIDETKFFKINKIYVFDITVWRGHIGFIGPHFYVITLFIFVQVCIFTSDLFLVMGRTQLVDLKFGIFEGFVT